MTLSCCVFSCLKRTNLSTNVLWQIWQDIFSDSDWTVGRPFGRSSLGPLGLSSWGLTTGTVGTDGTFGISGTMFGLGTGIDLGGSGGLLFVSCSAILPGGNVCFRLLQRSQVLLSKSSHRLIARCTVLNVTAWTDRRLSSNTAGDRKRPAKPLTRWPTA